MKKVNRNGQTKADYELVIFNRFGSVVVKTQDVREIEAAVEAIGKARTKMRLSGADGEEGQWWTE